MDTKPPKGPAYMITAPSIFVNTFSSASFTAVTTVLLLVLTINAISSTSTKESLTPYSFAILVPSSKRFI